MGYVRAPRLGQPLWASAAHWWPCLASCTGDVLADVINQWAGSVWASMEQGRTLRGGLREAGELRPSLLQRSQPLGHSVPVCDLCPRRAHCVKSVLHEPLDSEPQGEGCRAGGGTGTHCCGAIEEHALLEWREIPRGGPGGGSIGSEGGRKGFDYSVGSPPCWLAGRGGHIHSLVGALQPELTL